MSLNAATINDGNLNYIGRGKGTFLLNPNPVDPTYLNQGKLWIQLRPSVKQTATVFISLLKGPQFLFDLKFLNLFLATFLACSNLVKFLISSYFGCFLTLDCFLLKYFPNLCFYNVTDSKLFNAILPNKPSVTFTRMVIKDSQTWQLSQLCQFRNNGIKTFN